MNFPILKPSRDSRGARSAATKRFCKNPIIDRFLLLTVEEGHSVHSLTLEYDPDGAGTVIFVMDDGSYDKWEAEDAERSAFPGWWRDTAEFVGRIRRTDLSPAF